MKCYYYCLVFLSTVSVAVLFDVKKIYVIERDLKTGQLRARRQNVPAQSHTVARIGGLDQQNNAFGVTVSPPSAIPQQQQQQQQPQQQQQQQRPSDFTSAVDLTAADHRTPIDYLTPPPQPNNEFRFQNFQPTAGDAEPTTTDAHHQPRQNAVQALQFDSETQVASQHTADPFAPVAGAVEDFPSAALGSPVVQTSSSSNRVQSLTFANAPPEQFTPYSPTPVHEPVNPYHHQQQQQQQQQHQQHHQQQQQQQQQQNGGRWELGFDANDILTPPFAAPEQSGGGHTFFQPDFGQETASSVRNNKQYLSGGVFFGGAGFDGPVAANNNNNKFTPLDAVVRTSSPNNNVYWGTPKTAQQQPIRPAPSFAEPNAFRFNNNNNNNHHHHHPNHHHQYVDAFQMPFTGQFDGPLSQGTVADHVVHTSFRIKRQLSGVNEGRAVDDDDDDDGGAGSINDDDGDRKPVYSYVKTDRNGNFKWSVRHGY